MSPTLLTVHDIPATPARSVADARPILETIQMAAPIVVTAYVRMGVADRVGGACHVAVHDAVRRLRRQVRAMGLGHAEREGVERDLDRIEGYLQREGDRWGTPGLALFACEAAGLFVAVALPRVLRTSILLGQRPRLTEALGAADAFGRILTVLADRIRVRFFETTAFGVRELPDLRLEAAPGGRFHSDPADSPGWGEHDYHQRIREEGRRGVARIARRVEELLAQGRWQGVVLAGTQRTTAGLRRALAQLPTATLLGATKGNVAHTSAEEIRTATLAVRTAWEQTHEKEVVTAFERALGEGWAVDGVRATLRALEGGQLRTLLVPAGQAGAGFRCADSGSLVASKGECRGKGEPLPVADLVGEAVEAGLSAGVAVEVIDDEELKDRVAPLAGLLRYRTKAG